jgi:Na+-driven multidrug efflux pump
MDIWFVAGFHMGVAGVAWATFICQGISCVLAVAVVLRRLKAFTAGERSPLFSRQICAKIAKVAVPSTLQQSFISVGNIIIQGVINGFGPGVMAGYSAAVKLNNLVITSFTTLGNGISNYTAQNIGAGYHHRARQTLKYGIGLCMASGCLCALVCQIIPESIVGLFTSDPAVIVYGGQYLAAYGIDCIFAGIHFCFSGFFCAYGMSSISFIHNAISVVFVRVPGSYLASVWFPETLFPMGLAAPLGSILSVLICIGFYIWFRKRKRDIV